MSLLGRICLAVFMSVSIFMTIQTSSAVQAALPADELQALIDQAHPNDTLKIAAGEYIGSLVIDRTVTLVADGTVTLVNNRELPAIHITADHVRLRGFTIIDTTVKEEPTVLVEAGQAILEQLYIRTANHGIKLNGASNGEIHDSTIVWDTGDAPEIKLSNRRNGIDLYDAHENRLIDNTITDMHDGIYIENSHRNVVDGNQVDHMRYGIHCMYTDGTVISNNTGSYNITGAMVMAVKYVEVTNNTFIKQSENVHSQGILLFDAHSSQFYDNLVEGNRVGFYIEQSSDNIFLRNQIQQNFIGAQFIESNANRLSENLFSGNVIDAEARASADNQVDGNFWDSFSGIDYDGDGRSDIRNAINPFFQSMIKSKPAFQLFFQSPGMVFLEGMFQGERDKWMADRSPLMKPPKFTPIVQRENSNMLVGGIGLLLVVLAMITILYVGVRRT